MTRYFCTLLLVALWCCGFAQGEPDSLIVATDRDTDIEQRTVVQPITETYSGEEFNYDVDSGASQNLIRRFFNWFFGLLENTFGIDLPPNIGRILEIIIYIAMGGLALYFLIRFFVGENMKSVFTKKATSLIDLNLSEEHIENIDLDGLIQTALKQGDYRLAIRYQYLKALKLLSQHNLIEWHFEKTNSDYQREITQPQLQPLFARVSYLYDYIWYGEQPIDENRYHQAQRSFTSLANQLKS